MTAHTPDIEDDGFETIHPPQNGDARFGAIRATTPGRPQPARTAMTLEEARAVRADLAHHGDATLREAAQVIADQTDDDEERASALALLTLLT